MKITSLLLAFLMSLNFAFSQNTTSTDSILSDAYKKAAKENKHVLVIFHASWCGWCHKMDASINDETCRKYFEDNYVIAHLTVEESKDKKNLENPGAAELKHKYNGEMAGLPFWLVFDKHGNLVADSYLRKEGISQDQPGENMGCPGSPKEVEAFINILKHSSSLKPAALDIIANRFRQNAPVQAGSRG